MRSTGALEAKLAKDIERLLAEAAAAEGGEQEDGNRLPEEIGRREALQQKIRETHRRLEERTQQEVEEKRRKEKGQDEPPSDDEAPGNRPNHGPNNRLISPIPPTR